MANNTILAAQQMSSANKGQTSQGIVLQNYCNSVLQQPEVDFSGFPDLKENQQQINQGLHIARDHANFYLDTVQPQIITNITNIQNYFNLHQAVATVLPPGATEKQWLDTLSALKEQSQNYQVQSQSVVNNLNMFHKRLTEDAGSFAAYVSSLNAVVGGDKGVLASIDDQLGTIQSKIDGAIAGIVLSGLAIVGGVFLTAVGGVADFVTAGTSTPLVIAGIGIVAAGIGGEVASAITLKNLNDTKATLLKQKSTLTAEVNLVTGISGAIGSLQSQAAAAVTAASQMTDAWNFLTGDLGTLADDLNKGIISTGTLRTLFLTAANSAIQQVLQDTTIIKTQMTGVQSLVAPQGTNIGDYMVALATKQAA
ncbi:hypothetical protein HNQ59_002600 [Chitinivorax tropicus]|uniref:HBL/NHE enterotoxin family protein n=1 Tax=Chitinivorax tropicus TaxID=714531 RepID=A0A840MR90_9PROT|nr:HBL/NHE enterotoxin family protein [Chitinivorax tropicus]MBB5019302.1 hypothetical protein [Chitinivorax tropicus]